uniref:C-type lectin domain-containing protein n=1 Tax=Acrobeloides nanus TaxID=290746 RepID=A0A914CMK9_9BILA
MQLKQRHNFAWTDGTPLDYTKWGTGEPDGIGEDGAGANCMVIHSDFITGYEGLYETWDDDNCWVSMRAFVCKKPAYTYY